MADKPVFSYAGVVENGILYSLPNYFNILFSINPDTDEIKFYNTMREGCKGSHLLQTSLNVYEGKIVGAPGRGNSIFMYDEADGSFEWHRVTDVSEEFELEQYSSSVVHDHILYIFPLLAKQIIRFDLRRKVPLESVPVTQEETDYYYTRSSFAHGDRIIANNIFPSKLGGFFTVYDCASGELMAVSDTVSQWGQSGTSKVCNDRILSLCGNGELFAFDVDSLEQVSHRSGESADDLGFRDIFIKDSIAYCFSCKTGTVQTVDIDSMKSTTVPTEYDGFYGVYRIDDDRFIASTLGTEYAVIRVCGDRLVTEKKYDLNDNLGYRAMCFADYTEMRVEVEEYGLDVMLEAMKLGYM